MALNKIILQRIDNYEAFQYYIDTIKNPVDVNKISKYASQDQNRLLTEQYKSGEVHVWGVTPGSDGGNIHKWKKIGPGDITLFFGKDKVFASATVSYKIHSRELSIDLWGEDKKGEAREYVYFLDEVTDQNIPYVEFNKTVGYAPDHVIQEFDILDEEKSLLVFNAFGLGKNTGEDKEYSQLLDSSADTEPQAEQASEEKIESSVTVAEEPETANSESNTETPAEQVPEEEVPKSDIADSEMLEPLDTKSDAENQVVQVSEEDHKTEAISDLFSITKRNAKPQAVQVPEEEVPEGDIADFEKLEPLGSKSDTGPQVEQVSEEELESDITEAEEFEPVDSKDDIKTQLKRGLLKKIILAAIIGAIGYFIYLERQKRQPDKQKATNNDISVEATDKQKTSPPELQIEDTKFDFHETRWGMTKEQVKADKSTEIAYENNTAILYYGKVAGMKAATYYTFEEGVLVGTMHHFTEKHIDDNNYISDYKKVKDILVQKFGLPIRDEQQWSNDQYKDNSRDWGFAVRSGDLILRSGWETETTKIGLGLYIENHEIIHGIFYTNKKFKYH